MGEKLVTQVFVKVTLEDYLFNNMKAAKKEAEQKLWQSVISFSIHLHEKSQELENTLKEYKELTSN